MSEQWNNANNSPIRIPLKETAWAKAHPTRLTLIYLDLLQQ